MSLRFCRAPLPCDFGANRASKQRDSPCDRTFIWGKKEQRGEAGAHRWGREGPGGGAERLLPPAPPQPPVLGPCGAGTGTARGPGAGAGPGLSPPLSTTPRPGRGPRGLRPAPPAPSREGAARPGRLSRSCGAGPANKGAPGPREEPPQGREGRRRSGGSSSHGKLWVRQRSAAGAAAAGGRGAGRSRSGLCRGGSGTAYRRRVRGVSGGGGLRSAAALAPLWAGWDGGHRGSGGGRGGKGKVSSLTLSR